jgi:hypothetical protein
MTSIIFVGGIVFYQLDGVIGASCKVTIIVDQYKPIWNLNITYNIVKPCATFNQKHLSSFINETCANQRKTLLTHLYNINLLFKEIPTQ